jgi:hypothetical protein
MPLPGFTDEESRWLVRALRLPVESTTRQCAATTILGEVLWLCKTGGVWGDLAGRGVSKYAAMSFIDYVLEHNELDEAIRWKKHERTAAYDHYTVIADITTTCLQLKPSNDPRAPGYAHTSGHKGVVYKYLVATT